MESNLPIIIISAILLVWNLFVFILMGFDKHRAKVKRRRVSEKTLLTCAFLLGAPGEIIGAFVFHHKTKKTKFRIGLPLALVFNAVIICLALNGAVVSLGNSRLISGFDYTAVDSGNTEITLSDICDAGSLPDDRDSIIVLGCGILDENTPSPMLKDRLDCGIALYNAGAAPKLLLSGDNGTQSYNEIYVMAAYCLSHGVPEEDIYCDYAGFSTYDSMYRASSIFDVKRPVVVTQKYHEYRALYIARSLGIDAVGISSDRFIYSGQSYREAREILARVKDLLKCVFRLPSKLGGEKIPIQGPPQDLVL